MHLPRVPELRLAHLGRDDAHTLWLLTTEAHTERYFDGQALNRHRGNNLMRTGYKVSQSSLELD